MIVCYFPLQSVDVPNQSKIMSDLFSGHDFSHATSASQRDGMSVVTFDGVCAKNWKSLLPKMIYKEEIEREWANHRAYMVLSFSVEGLEKRMVMGAFLASIAQQLGVGSYLMSGPGVGETFILTRVATVYPAMSLCGIEGAHDAGNVLIRLQGMRLLIDQDLGFRVASKDAVSEGIEYLTGLANYATSQQTKYANGASVAAPDNVGQCFVVMMRDPGTSGLVAVFEPAQ